MHLQESSVLLLLQRIALLLLLGIFSANAFKLPSSSFLSASPSNSRRNTVLLLLSMISSPDNETSTSTSTSTSKRLYPIGTPGTAWTTAEDEQWKANTKRQRSYQTEVLDKLDAIIQSQNKNNDDLWTVEAYGGLSHDPERYPLMVVRSNKNTAAASTATASTAAASTAAASPKTGPTVLITGGVHGYETSGVQGALEFLTTSRARDYIRNQGVEFVVAPCVSPWAYEHIQRWQADVQDPNRSFTNDGDTEESQALLAYIKTHFPDSNGSSSNGSSSGVVEGGVDCHLDLHETTDTDATEFRPAKHAKAGLTYEEGTIPDGFYLVTDSKNPQLDFQEAVLRSVEAVTHIAPPDVHGQLIDIPILTQGVIGIPVRDYGLCCSMTHAKYVTTTEVYPDSPKVVTSDDCNKAQIAAIVGAVDYLLAHP